MTATAKVRPVRNMINGTIWAASEDTFDLTTEYPVYVDFDGTRREEMNPGGQYDQWAGPIQTVDVTPPTHQTPSPETPPPPPL